MAGDDSFGIYPRKGEFFVFDPPGGRPLEQILLPCPLSAPRGCWSSRRSTARSIAGPTAHDQEDKGDWSVRTEASDEVMPKVVSMLPALEGAEPIASYAGLRPAGRDGVNYAIGPSVACPGLVNVAAIRSTGLTASLGIAEHVAGLVAEHGIELGAEASLPASTAATAGGPWWRRTAEYRGCRHERAPDPGRRRGHHRGEGGAVRRAPPTRAEARREKENRIRSPAGSSRTARRCSTRWPERSPSCWRTRPARSSPAAWTTRASRCSRGTQSRASRSRPIVVWQDKRSQEVLDRIGGDEEEIRRRSGLPFDPYFSAAKLAWLLEHDGGSSGARRRHAPDGHRRLVPLRPPRSRFCHRRLYRVAHATAHARHAGLRSVAVRALRRATRGPAGGARHDRRAGHAPARELAGRAAPDRADRGPAGRAGRRGLRRARPRKGHLRDRRVRARPCRRRGPPERGRAAAHGGLEHRRPRGVRPRRRRVRRRGDARVAV